MKKSKVELTIFGITLLLASFTLGFFLGKDQVPHVTEVTTIEESRESLPLPVQEQEQAEPMAPVVQPEPAVVFPLDLNTASAAELEQLPGIGPELAKRIVEYRVQWGRFVEKEQVMDVKGIGEGKYAAIEQLITVEVQNENSGGG